MVRKGKLTPWFVSSSEVLKRIGLLSSTKDAVKGWHVELLCDIFIWVIWHVLILLWENLRNFLANIEVWCDYVLHLHQIRFRALFVVYKVFQECFLFPLWMIRWSFMSLMSHDNNLSDFYSIWAQSFEAIYIYSSWVGRYFKPCDLLKLLVALLLVYNCLSCIVLCIKSIGILIRIHLILWVDTKRVCHLFCFDIVSELKDFSFDIMGC